MRHRGRIHPVHLVPAHDLENCSGTSSVRPCTRPERSSGVGRGLTTHYGTAIARSWDRLHPPLTHRTCWLEHHGELPIIAGTLLRLQVDHLPGDRDPKPVWLWCSATDATPDDVDRWWQAFLRRFDIEHTFRLFKQTLGWTRPKIRTPQAADRWSWLIIVAHTQLRLARPIVEDCRKPWERSVPGHKLTPARVRRGVSEHPPDDHLAGQCTKTQPAWPRTTTRLTQPPSRTTPRRRQNRQTRAQSRSGTKTNRLNKKLKPGLAFVLEGWSEPLTDFWNPTKTCGGCATTTEAPVPGVASGRANMDPGSRLGRHG